MPYCASRLGLVILLSVACGGKDGDDGTTSGGSGETTTGSSTSPTTTDSSTTGTTSAATTTGTDSGSTGSTTGVDVSGFDFFRLSKAAGPCGPDQDCDGFVELLSTGMLRVEKFGDVTEQVFEVQISADDLAAAAQVFADPALVAVLDGPDPLCNPPTDIFEAMDLQIDGVLHDATTTTCDQAPLVAAREKANALQMQYVP